MPSLKDLKKNRASMFEKLANEVEKIKTGNTDNKQTDDRFWQPTKDKAGNAIAVIRFLYPLTEDPVPWAQVFSHGFKNPSTGTWYIEKCPTTIQKKCPVCEANTVLWNSGVDKDKDVVRSRKRVLRYISNIIVVKDPAHPENDGKVFLFSFGKKIFDKINEAMFPQFEDEKPMNPFDAWEGANFKLKVRQFEGYTNYDKSEFAAVEALAESDAEIEKILSKCLALTEFTDSKSFKPYEELKQRFSIVMGQVEQQVEEEVVDDDPVDGEEPVVEAVVKAVSAKAKKEEMAEHFGYSGKEEKKEAPKKEVEKPKEKTKVDEEEDEMEAYLKSLAE